MKIQKTHTHDEDDIHRPIVCQTTIEINFNSKFVAIVWNCTNGTHRKRVNCTVQQNPYLVLQIKNFRLEQSSTKLWTMAYVRMWHCLVPSTLARFNEKKNPGSWSDILRTTLLVASCKQQHVMSNDEPICDLCAFYIQLKYWTNRKTCNQSIFRMKVTRLLDFVVLSAIVIGVRMPWTCLVMAVGLSTERI